MIRKAKNDRNRKRRRKHGFWNMSRAVKGSVTLLLVMLLLPMITFSTLIIDASRLQSVRTSIAGAGDLTLNAMMSEYNVLLQDMYGLFANCKNMNDLKPALEAYFRQSAESFVPAGTLDGNKDVQEMIQKATNLVLDNNGNIPQDSLTDFLNMALVDNQFRAEGVYGGALANPNIMKQQIVEYMKYRGPVSIASTLLGKLNVLSNASSQTDACDKKVDYNKSLGKLKDPCSDAFKAIEEKYNMGALLMNCVIRDGFEGDVSKWIDAYTQKGTESPGMDEIIARSKLAYERATIFYLLNAKSPFREKKPDYNEMKKEALNNPPEGVKLMNVNSLIVGCSDDASAAEKVAAYQKTLDNIAQEYDKLINVEEKEIGIYENEFDSIYVPEDKRPEYKVDLEHYYFSQIEVSPNEVKYNLPLEQPPNYLNSIATRTNYGSNDKIPTCVAVKKDWNNKGSWYYIMDDRDAEKIVSDDIIEKQIAYGKKMLEMQEDVASGYYYKGIKKYAVYKENITRLYDLYAEYANRLCADDLRQEYFKETVLPEVMAREENAGKAETDLGDQLKETWFEESKKQFVNYLWKKPLYQACTLAMSKNEEEIKAWLEETSNNDKYFLKYAQQYSEEAYSTIFALGQSLELMKDGLTTLSSSLDKILEVMEDIEKKKKAWKESIDTVDSDSTKAAMLNDYSTAIDKLDREEIEKLKKIVSDELKPQVDKQLQMVKSVKYLGQPLYKVDKVSNLMKDQAQKDICADIEKKIKSKILQLPAKAIAAKANDKVWDMIDQGDILPVFPDYSHDSTIFNTPFDLKDNDSLKAAAKDLVKNHYDSSGFVIKDFKRFRVLDGINDKKTFSAYDSDDMDEYDVIGKKEKVKNGGTDDLLDPDEAFVITLYAEYKASQKAAEKNGGDDADKDVPKNSDQENLEKVADKGRNDANKGNQPAVTQAGGQKEPEQTVTTVTANFGEIMKGIEGYCKQNEKAKTEKAPDCPNSSIDNKNPSKSDGGKGLKNAKDLLGKITNLGNVILQNVYLEEYMTEMFTCRTDNQKLNKLTAKPDKDVLPVILLNGYTNQKARASYNSNANSSARTSRFINENTDWYGKEIEYLLFGHSTLKDNLTATDGTIFAIRFALNAIYAFTAPDIQSFALEVATAIAGWTVIGVPIVQACITILIALAESGYDIYLLHDGQNVAIYKNAQTFVCSPSGLLKQVVSKAAEEIIDKVVEKAVDKVEEELDKGVDKITQKGEDLATKKVSEYANDLKQTVNQYADQQTEALKSAVCNMFVTPILNNIVPVESLIEAGERYKTADPSALIGDAVRKAFEQVEKTVDGMEDNAAKRVAKKLLEKNKKQMIDTVTAKLSSYFNTPEASRGELNEIITETFIGKSGIPGLIDNVKNEIDGEIDKVKDTINDNIKKYGDMAATNVKDFMHEQFDQASEQISGHLKESAKKLTDKIPGKSGTGLDTGATSGGFSLNYKEYCKILMMIFICTNENQILQRAAVMITANMRNPYPKNPLYKDGNVIVDSKFEMKNANTLFSVSAQVEMKTLFPWGVQDNQGDGNADTGLKLDLSELGNNSIKINYCGINGY